MRAKILKVSLQNSKISKSTDLLNPLWRWRWWWRWWWWHDDDDDDHGNNDDGSDNYDDDDDNDDDHGNNDDGSDNYGDDDDDVDDDNDAIVEKILVKSINTVPVCILMVIFIMW
jgi:hypothetical protein